MEKTIEERAKESGIVYAGWNDTLRNGLQEGYKLGATEQKAIDIDKACEWLTLMLQCGCHPCSGRQFVIDFRKMMEE